MSIRDNLDISAYLVLGPENTLGRPVGDVVAQALDAGFTCIQVRSKVASAREIIALTGDAAQAIAQAGKTGQVALLIDDRLDCVLAAREQGIAVDGVHVGQSDIPVEVCRKLLGPDAIVGLSAETESLVKLINELPSGCIDYIVYTGALKDATTDDYIALHRRALQLGIPCFTSLDTANALADIIASRYNEHNTELVDINHMRTKRQRLKFSKMQATGDD